MPLYGKHAFAQWYMLGGPFVRRHNGRYYCFFSGANFLTDRYGVDYCGADCIMGPYANSGSDAGAWALHSVPVHVRGSGYYSHALGPDGRTEYLIYLRLKPGYDQTPSLPRQAGPDGPRPAVPGTYVYPAAVTFSQPSCIVDWAL